MEKFDYVGRPANDSDNMIQTVIRNLVSNAIKFTSPGGVVRVSCRAGEAGNVVIAVNDSGIGMDEKMVENLFRADFDTKRPGTSEEKSTGLGLLLCKEFIEAHGAELVVESRIGVGSEFRFTLPLGDLADVNKPSEYIGQNVVKENCQGKLKVLIAEDDIISGKLNAAMIRDFCGEVLVARTGSNAIEISRLNPDVDFILMDISMPQVDGYEASRRIREFNKEVIIIAQTALASESDIKDALAAGCNDHIIKPINSNELKLLIQKYFN